MTRQSDQQQGKQGNIPNPVQIQKFLGGLDYPVSKQELLDRAKEEGADEQVLDALDQLPDQDYNSPKDVSREVGRLQ